MKQYNSLLRKLRFLGIYHDEHMVSQRAFLDVKIYRCTNLSGAIEAKRNAEQFLPFLWNLKQFHGDMVHCPKEKQQLSSKKLFL